MKLLLLSFLLNRQYSPLMMLEDFLQDLALEKLI